jgi:hypothetical protein
VPATEVARRLGHDVAVLLKIYANCIDGQEGEINDRITAALTAHHDHETLPPAPAVDTAAQTKPADQSQDGRLWTPQDRRSALVAQGIEHRFPKRALAVASPPPRKAYFPSSAGGHAAPMTIFGVPLSPAKSSRLQPSADHTRTSSALADCSAARSRTSRRTFCRTFPADVIKMPTQT